MEVSKELKDEIWNYCRANNITNIDEFMLKCLKQGFTSEKFGATPSVREKIVEKEVEKIVEVEVEKIVEKIIEVQVEKQVFITDNKEMQKLTKEIDRLNKNGQLAAEVKDKALNELAALEIEHEKLKIELEQEKKKKKTDFYGE
jgi:ABC-type phosphate transport system auxiliary subunit